MTRTVLRGPLERVIVVLSDEQLEEVLDALDSALETLAEYGDEHRLVMMELVAARSLVLVARHLMNA